MIKNIFSLFSLLFLLFLSSLFSIEKTDIGNEINVSFFKTLPDSVFDKGTYELINKIRPIKCNYWQCVYVSTVLHVGEKGDVVVYNGDSVKYKRIADEYASTNYFLPACHPDYCGYYIVAVNDSNNVKVYDNENINEFIGSIDNLEEMVLSTNIHGYRFSNDTIVRGSYLECDSTYLLNVTELGNSHCYCSTKATLSKSGKFKIMYKEILLKNKNDSIFYMP